MMGRVGPRVEAVEALGLYHFHPGCSLLQVRPGAVEIAQAVWAGCRGLVLTADALADAARVKAIAARAEGLDLVAVLPGRELPEGLIRLDAARVTLEAAEAAFGLCQELLVAGGWLELLCATGGGDRELHERCVRLHRTLGATVPLHLVAGGADGERAVVHGRWIALEAGLEFVYAAAAPDGLGSCTFCPNCEACLVERDGGGLRSCGIGGGVCSRCAMDIPGRWDRPPGHWQDRDLGHELG